nr:EamA family transporter [Microbacterium halimionae]
MCQEVGASFAVLLFPQTGPLGMVMLRLVFSAAILLLIARPALRGHSWQTWRSILIFGIVLALMNTLFYLALDRLALGVTVTIEVLGPLVLSIVASRSRAAWLWAVLAFAGVAALGSGGWDRLDPLGVVFALGAAASWAFYILASAKVGGELPGLQGLALAMALGAVISAPLGILDAGTALGRIDVLALAAAVAVLSSTIPYAFEIIALRRVAASVFAVLMSLGPAIAAVAGLVLLGQQLVWLEVVGIALVIIASMGAVFAASRASRASRAASESDPTASDSVKPDPTEEPFSAPMA